MAAWRRMGFGIQLLAISSGIGLAAPAPNPGPDDINVNPEPSHACGDLIRNTLANDGIVPAIDVYNCWVTVPINPAVATRFIQYWNDTLQFQSTLDYLKNPPTEYQQPAVDLIAGLNEIQAAIDNNLYANEYQFEAALQNVIYSGNDPHISLFGGILSSFSFGTAHGLTSLSVDGVELPKVYLTDDLILNQTEPDASWQPSAISRINGTDAIDYFTRFAALNSWGTTEPHADWNLLVDNPLIDVLDAKYSLWGGSTTFYPGDTFTYVFENGSTFEEQWLAAYYDPGDTGPLETGGDFYNFFVLGFYPASYNVTTDETEANVTGDAGEPLTSFSDINSAFPRADVWQQNLTVDGYLTGYFLRDESLAVLSIPTFWADGEAIQAFADTVQDFLSQSKAAGMERVLVDLQQNAGGDIALAYSTFKQFFPATEPFAGSVMRANPLANILGSTITDFWDTLDITDPRYQDASADEWIATTKINAATRRNFTSWTEMYGPHFDGVSNFTVTERLNTSNFLFDYSMMGQQNPPPVLLTPYAGEPPYAAEDIIMLSDGLCSSACSLFMEMMHNDAGVKNVVIGGRPSYGPMQTPSGSRGARYYDFIGINADYQNAVGVAEILREDSIVDIDVSILNPLNYSDFFVYDAGISLRAQVREGDTVPLSMRYEAADCRIFWTPDTFQNFTNLWSYANAAITTSPSLCAEGSTGYTGPSAQPAPAAQRLAAVNYSSIGVPNLDLNPTGIADIPFLVSDGPLPDVPPVYIPRPMKLAYPDYVPRPQYLNKAQEEAYDKQQQQRYNDRLQQNNIKKHLSCGFSAPPCKRSIRKRRKLS